MTESPTEHHLAQAGRHLNAAHASLVTARAHGALSEGVADEVAAMASTVLELRDRIRELTRQDGQ